MNKRVMRPTDCCDEFARASAVSRRRFLAGMTGAGAAIVTSSVFGDAFRQASFAASVGSGGNVMVVISLRGGIDGLGMVVPHGDPGYYKARPSIAVPKASLIAADDMFGLHPKMAPLKWMWDAGQLAAVHAVGLSVPNRSHFAAIEDIEDADPGTNTRNGWINRMVGLSAANPATEAVQLGSAMLPSSIYGSSPTLATTSVDQMTLIGAEDTSSMSDRRRQQLSMVWGGHNGDTLFDAGRAASATADLLSTVPAASTVAYPTTGPASDLGAALRDTARLIKADVGTDVVTVDYGSWDMHADYGTLAGGDMVDMTSGLAGAVNAFMQDLGTLRSKVTVITISEFGRRIKENGNKGVDHGWGNMMLVAGAGVKGGKYYGSWPGLGSGSDDDLQVTTDYRNVLGEVVASRFPSRSLSTVFPSLRYSPLGVMSAAS